ncbi:Cell fate regulator YaaT, PSP1 superfamily (controls sporulation, competence, biofilm development) [Sporobacter termitidis DSM 10068]|uniref:Cell fate regulator YaaT, PSP1 superfamily (Controls sporulation, competence, biofilm development) n=1 Tax=Sporobacter termitidis DSM 10068 TaxID=1123282 RepID=A0A1M5Z6M8_9FIRM|nr:stage 0 sporulation family protein [Sporobacter termitidis]SHI19906.1 Cell fate regulator YaaT, PSP1 superfamily (controls sporulation, competence, biofilm development) [Sporobacter termitidis DSM 10068]
MTEVISVRFKNKGKIYFFDPTGQTVPTNAHVVVETAKGLEYAECTCGNHDVEDTAIIPPLRPVVRVATAEDDRKAAENKAKESEAFEFCQKKIAEHRLDMKLVDVEFSFEGSKILFFFTSDGRVDFRELVKDLASVFKTRIELRQIGVRDEARMLGGLGICGKPFCCEQFLDEFHPVSIKMAKTQGLSLNPVKISGTCGRLMCCLKYEENAYEDLVKKAPKIDAFVDTPSGKGSVISINLLRGNAKVRLEDGMDTTLKTFTFDELDVLGGKARRAEYIAARAEGKLEEAGFTERPREPRFEPKPETRSEPRPEQPRREFSSEQARRPEHSPRNEQRNGRPHHAKPAPKAEKKQPPVQKEAAQQPQGDKAAVKKPGKRHHRGGKGRNKFPKPAGGQPAGAADSGGADS